MGVARLLAKGWVVFCLFAAAHGINLALAQGDTPLAAVQEVVICLLLFGAMGLLFIGGFGASSGGTSTLVARLKPRHLMPGFNETVFVAFVVLSFLVQIFLSSPAKGGPVADALQNAMYFVVPGQHALAARLIACTLGHDRIYALALSSAFAWLLSVIFVASALSRIGLTAGILRLERTLRPSSFGPTLLAAMYGLVAIVSFQLLYVGTAFIWLDCGIFTGIAGSLLTGLAPLMLAYLIVAALATLKASAPEG